MTVKLKTIPLFGTGITSKSLVVNSQRRLNCFYDLRQDGDKTEVAIYGTPGMKLAFTIGTQYGYPVRGIVSTTTAFYAVSNNTFYALDESGNTVASGIMTTISGNASITFNSTQIITVDGTNGWIYTISSLAFAQIIDANFPNGAQTVTFLNGYFIVEKAGTNQFFVSNLNDGTTWNSLASGSASQYPDNLLAVDNLGGMLILFSEHHMEFWQNVGSIPLPFQYIANSANEYGLGAIFSRQHVGGSIIFLSQTREGGYQIASLSGYAVTVVSTDDIDTIINSFSIVDDAVALVYQSGSHKFYQITFPTENRTLLFDVTTQIWSEVQTGVASGYASRHIGLLSADLNGQSYITDYNNGNVYNPDPAMFTDNGNIIVRKIITRHTLSDFNRIRMTSIYLDMETGVGLNTGQGSNPQIVLRVSKDNGRTWSSERWVSLGAMGQYLSRVIWRRLGSARDFVLEFTVTDPVKFVITKGAAVLSRRSAA